MPSHLTLLLLLSLLLSLATADEYRCNKDDRKALLAIKNHLNNPKSLSRWTSDPNCCDYLICDSNDRVTRFYFNQLEGTFTLPPALADLPYLTELQFYEIHGLTGSIPPFIGEMKGLVVLTLRGGKLTGPIPDFSKLTNLQSLDLSFNRLSGSIPPSLGLLPAIQYIEMSGNQLTGEIPAPLGTSPATWLQLDNNNLVGTIPKTFANNKYLFIDLSRNRLTGDALVLFGPSKPYLATLDLSKNAFEFDMSKARVPGNITRLDISHNKIYGRLLPEMGEHDFWLTFNVSYNRLCGPIPVFKHSASGLSEYEFFHNKCLCGAPLPPCK